MVKKKYTFIDLFAGCGGLSEGFYRLGFKALAHVEINHWACETLRTRMKYYGYKNVDKEVIEHDIKHTNVRIDPYQNGIGINERVQTSSTGTSYAEKEIMKEIERLEKERVSIIKQILKYKAKKRELENYISNIEFNINMLNEENKRFLELKYSDEAGVVEIAHKMNMSLATVYRIREEIIKNIANFMNIIK